MVSKTDLYMGKSMLYVWWSVRGVECWEMPDEGVTVSAEVYISQLQKLKTHLLITRGESVNLYI